MKHKSIVIFFSIIALFSATAFTLPSFAEKKEEPAPESAPPIEEVFEPVALYKDNWFDFVNEYWEKYSTTATIIDINSGRSYVVKRVGGYNHADVEPIDKNNTAIMHSIYNNTWQWTRRPVWVKIKDRYIAASINGYPHAYDYIEGNDMVGHTCVHFYMSRTHGSNKVDPDHKQAIETAFALQNTFQQYVQNQQKN